MNDKLQETKNFIQELSEQLYMYISRISPSGMDLIFHINVKLSVVIVLFLITDFVLKIVINSLFRLFYEETRFPILKSIYHSKLTNSLAHLIALLVIGAVHESIFSGVLNNTTELIKRSVNLGILLIFVGILYRSLIACRYYFNIKHDYYKIMALKTIAETVKNLGGVIFSVVGLCVIFGIKGTTIVGSLGAMTAVLVLVFRDTVLGLVTALHVATFKNLKVDDWIRIPKYNIEGNITEISLLTTKITNFDKTVSTIPTYDLMATEIKNFQIMSESNTRRIKKSIYFNINSFRFLTDENIERLKEVNLISDYLEEKSIEIKKEKESLENKEKIVNGRQLTNIGVFRLYAQKYIESDPNIDEKEARIVRQLDIIQQGLSLEIYCFANDSKWERFEQIQADIFDHLLVASKEFDLQVMQINVKL